LIIDQHRGQRALRNLEVVPPREKAFPRFGALPGSGNVVQDPVPPLVSDPQQIAAVEGIGEIVVLLSADTTGMGRSRWRAGSYEVTRSAGWKGPGAAGRSIEGQHVGAAAE
jgi:hypothetical protein